MTVQNHTTKHTHVLIPMLIVLLGVVVTTQCTLKATALSFSARPTPITQTIGDLDLPVDPIANILLPGTSPAAAIQSPVVITPAGIAPASTSNQGNSSSIQPAPTSKLVGAAAGTSVPLTLVSDPSTTSRTTTPEALAGYNGHDFYTVTRSPSVAVLNALILAGKLALFAGAACLIGLLYLRWSSPLASEVVNEMAEV